MSDQEIADALQAANRAHYRAIQTGDPIDAAIAGLMTDAVSSLADLEKVKERLRARGVVVSE